MFIPIPKSILGLALVLAVFAASAFYQIDLPGLHNDESREAGLLALQLAEGLPVDAFRGVGIGPRSLPLMVQDYIGALNVYLTAPAIALFGPGAASVRAVSIFVGLASLVTTFGFVRSAFGSSAALIAAGLLAVHPSFLFWNRQGVLVASLTITFAGGLLWAFAAWARSGGKRFAFLCGLLAGLGVYAKLLFVWVIAAGIGSLVSVNAVAWVPALVARRPLRFWPRRPSGAETALAGTGLLAGLSPLVAYNLLSSGTLRSVGGNLTTSFYGVDNLDFASNLIARWDQFRAVIAGRDHFWYLGGSAGNPAWEWALATAVLVIAAAAVRRRASWPAALGLLLVLAFGIMQTAFTVSGLFPTHFAIFTPLWASVVAVAAVRVGRTRLGRGKFGRVSPPLVVLLALAGLAGRDLFVDAYYHRQLAATGGLGVHSDAIYRLVDELERLGTEDVVAMDWGFAPQVQQLSGNQIVPAEVFGYSWAPDPEFANRVTPYLAQSGTAFVFHWGTETIFPRKADFERVAAAAGARYEQVAIVSRRDGAPIYEILIVAWE